LLISDVSLVGYVVVIGYDVGTLCGVVVVTYCIGLDYYYYVILFGFSVLSYLMTFYEIYLIVLVYSLVVAYYFNCVSLETVVAG
jgi:hypothetical protein